MHSSTGWNNTYIRKHFLCGTAPLNVGFTNHNLPTPFQCQVLWQGFSLYGPTRFVKKVPTPLLNLNKFSVQQHYFTLGTPSYTQSESGFFVGFASWFLNNQNSGQQRLGHNQNQNNKINRQPPHWSWDVKQCKLIINSTTTTNENKTFLKNSTDLAN